jgi:hypothetical protein
MKSFQNVVILLTLIVLVAYTVYDKITRQTNIATDERLNMESFSIELPDKFDFCGESVPMKEADVRERFDKEMHINVYWHSSTYLVIKRANKWLPKIEKVLKEQGIPADFKYLAVTESGLTNVVSPAGATGFWQFIESTALNYGLVINEEIDERYDPVKSTYAACKYFKEAYRKFGNWTLVAASYNRGIGGMEKALQEQKAKSYYDLELNNETSRYLFRVLAFKEILENPQKYKFGLDRKNLYFPEQTKIVTVNTSINNLVDFALENGISYKSLKRFNPWLRSNKLTVKDNKIYQIEIPIYDNDDTEDDLLLNLEEMFFEKDSL